MDSKTQHSQFHGARTLRQMGLNRRTCTLILRSWYASPTAGVPDGLLREVLIFIAQLNEYEDDMPPRPVFDGSTGKKGPPRSQWDSIFAEVLTLRTRAILREIGVYDAPDWVEAKYIVGRMLRRNWATFTGLKDADDLEMTIPRGILYRCIRSIFLWRERTLAAYERIIQSLRAKKRDFVRTEATKKDG
ncbi:hypothetical protein F5B22DRAFT_657665 [Xylaria bambusicola]|uniref:uncharacterized protein n=1 Tax=Xylaria bambusicola TaxID=326684 RepID=UPI00200753D1|nr:uncharacterized protein F5B22DRAFT_657665 [Xylaria bambusicola]KAI0512835.1 hypothetical protein F5B22DRAFT_657665 [Xylaria bambusicola]